MLSVFKNLNQFAGNNKFLDFFAIFFARLLPYLIFIFLFIFSIITENLYFFIFLFLAGFFSKFAINELIHIFYKRERPAALPGTKTLIPVPKNYSFPSGHASFFFGISFFVFFYFETLGLVLLLLSFLIGVARVFCGVHWFRDIIAGAGAGLISGLLLSYLFGVWQAIL